MPLRETVLRDHIRFILTDKFLSARKNLRFLYGSLILTLVIFIRL